MTSRFLIVVGFAGSILRIKPKRDVRSLWLPQFTMPESLIDDSW